MYNLPMKKKNSKFITNLIWYNVRYFETNPMPLPLTSNSLVSRNESQETSNEKIIIDTHSQNSMEFWMDKREGKRKEEQRK